MKAQLPTACCVTPLSRKETRRDMKGRPFILVNFGSTIFPSPTKPTILMKFKNRQTQIKKGEFKRLRVVQQDTQGNPTN
jgi:hypothetical protein